MILLYWINSSHLFPWRHGRWLYLGKLLKKWCDLMMLFKFSLLLLLSHLFESFRRVMSGVMWSGASLRDLNKSIAMNHHHHRHHQNCRCLFLWTIIMMLFSLHVMVKKSFSSQCKDLEMIKKRNNSFQWLTFWLWKRSKSKHNWKVCILSFMINNVLFLLKNVRLKTKSLMTWWMFGFLFLFFLNNYPHSRKHTSSIQFRQQMKKGLFLFLFFSSKLLAQPNWIKKKDCNKKARFQHC